MNSLGAHISIAGGYDKALDRLSMIGGNCLQIFSTSPRSWGFSMPSPDSIDTFIASKKRLSISPVYFHASYLLNLASNERIGEFSKKSIIHELTLTQDLDIKGTVIHLGSYKGVKTEENKKILFKNIEYILAKSPKSSYFIIENAGTNKLCQKLEEIADIIQNLKDTRLKVCLDTCHLHAAGYDLSTSHKFESFLDMFHTLIGIDRLELIHMNDSKDVFGSCRDRHENIGEGNVGLEIFRNIITHPSLRHLPLILETPGFEGEGPDKKNVDILKNLFD